MGAWRRSVVLATLFAVCGSSRTAIATPVETLGDAVLHPGEPDTITLIYQMGEAADGGGVIHTVDGGETWKLGCNDAIGASRPTAFAVGGSGELYMGLFTALLVDDTARCAFAAAPEFIGRWISDVTVDPDDPSVVLAITSGGGDIENGIWRRTDTGAFEEVGGRERVLISRVRVVGLPAGGERYYETIARGETMEVVDGLPRYFANYFVRSSDDGAETWSEHPFPKTEGSLRLELIAPKDADSLVVSVDNLGEGETDFVLVSDDAGASFRQVVEVERLGGVALSADGRLWVGDESGGLFAGALGDALELVSAELRPTCLRFEPVRNRLYVCEAFGFGFYDEAGDTLVKLFDITKTEAFLDCGDVRDEPEACEDQMFSGFCGFTHFPGAPICWQNYPDRVPHPDGGGGDAGAVRDPDDAGHEAGAGDSSGADADCGCTVPGAARTSRSGAGLASLLGILVLWWRRRCWRIRPALRPRFEVTAS